MNMTKAQIFHEDFRKVFVDTEVLYLLLRMLWHDQPRRRQAMTGIYLCLSVGRG